MRHIVQGPFHGIDGHASVAAVVDAGPAETHQFEFLLELGIDTVGVGGSAMDKGDTDLGAVVVLPEVLTKHLEEGLYAVYDCFDD
jgi:uncharacterized protein (UPF0264 family)